MPPVASASTATGPSSVSAHQASPAQRGAPAARVRSELGRVHLSAAGGARGYVWTEIKCSRPHPGMGDGRLSDDRVPGAKKALRVFQQGLSTMSTTDRCPLNPLGVTLLPLIVPQCQGSSPQPGLWLPALLALSCSLALLWAASGLQAPWLSLLTDVFILDVDECAATDRCLGGHCVNTEGSFSCLCEAGFQPSPENGECVGKGSRGSGQVDAPRLPTSTPAWSSAPRDQALQLAGGRALSRLIIQWARHSLRVCWLRAYPKMTK